MVKSMAGKANPFARKPTLATTSAGAEPHASCPPHLTPLADPKWALWRTIGLRGAGFPAADVLKLAAPECAARADQLAAAESELEQARAGALDYLRGELHKAGKDAPASLEKAIKRIKQGRLPELPDGGQGGE